MLNYLNAFILYPLAEKAQKRSIGPKLKVLRQLNQKSISERVSYQQEQLYKIINHAGLTVPYYRDLFKKISFKPDNLLKSSDYLQDIPLLTKEILREQGTRLISESFQDQKLHVRRTNGSTGLLTTIWYNQEALDWTAAANLYASEFSGRKHYQQEAHLLSGLVSDAPLPHPFVQTVKCWSLNRTNIFTSNFDSNSLQKLISEVKKAKPYSVQAHPSTLYYMALEAQKNPQQNLKLFEAFESTGETLDKSKLETIENAFGCKVFNRYGNAEFGVIAHSRDDYNELEFFDTLVAPESHSLGNGLEEIVLTGLTNYTMPLLRYKTGDVGEVIKMNDKYHLKGLVGRVHDLVNVDGINYPTHYFKDVLDQVGGVDEFQIIEHQGRPKRILKIVAHQGVNKSAIEAKINSIFKDSFTIEYTDFEGLIKQGWRDKFRYLVRAN